MSLTVDQIARISSNAASLAILFRLDTAPPVRFWSGAGEIRIPVDVIEPSGAIYYGAGALGPLPEMSELINAVAERIQFGFSSTDPDIAAIMDGDTAQIRNKTVNIGMLPLDKDLKPVDTALWFRRYTADVISIDVSSDNLGKQTSTITVSATSAFSGRRRPSPSYFTDVDQRLRSPDDRFCERTPLYSQGVTKKWPKF